MSLPVFESGAFIRHWWHSSLDLAPNQRLFNVFAVIHEIGSKLYEKSSICIYEKKGLGYFRFFYRSSYLFSFQQKVLSGIWNVNHNHPSKTHFHSEIGFWGKHWILILEATILNRCFLWWNKSFCICMFFVKLFKPLIFLPRRYLNYCNCFLCFASSFKKNLFQHLFYFLWNNWLQSISF